MPLFDSCEGGIMEVIKKVINKFCYALVHMSTMIKMMYNMKHFCNILYINM